ncbi:MAG: hypothetical protein AAF449_07395, partial [Myxococcota bacterium]
MLNASRMWGPTSRLEKGLLRARNMLSEDTRSLRRLDVLVESDGFKSLSTPLQDYILTNVLSVSDFDDDYVNDIFRVLERPPDWSAINIRQLLTQMTRHANGPSTRASLLKFSRLSVVDRLSTATRGDLIAYLGGPSDGLTTANQRSLQAWWHRRRKDLLNSLAKLSMRSAKRPEVAVSDYIGLASRFLTLVDTESTRVSSYGIIFGEPAEPTEYAYFVAMTKDRAKRRQVRLHATQPLDRRVARDRTLHGLQTKLSRREEFLLISWIQENHWIGIDWIPDDGEELPPGTIKNMSRLVASVKNMAVTFAAPRGVLNFEYIRL